LRAWDARLLLKTGCDGADSLAMRPLAPIAAAALLAAGLAATARADIYRWTDAQGRTRFTQDLSQVPPEQRAAAERTGRKETRSSEPPPAALTRVATAARGRAGRAIEIPFERQGNAMIVYVRVNDAVTAPFLVDTGASDVVVPGHVARAAGIRVTRDTPRQSYQTANGMIDSPIVTLASVEVGAARVENLRGSLSDSMAVGLLGASFFNNFTFQVDPAAHLITLLPNAQLRGGASQPEWRERFQELRREIAAIDAHTAGAALLDDARVRTFAQKRAALEAELEALDREATVAGVPQAWRE
jgi:clan AA aspartic protease (TIGR02281 family)